MNEINIFGFPKSMKKTKIFQILKYMIFRKRLRCKFWINDIVPDSDPNFVIVLMNIVKKDDASKAIDLINDFVYYDLQNDLHFSAVNVTDRLTSDEYNEHMPEKKVDQGIRDREARQTNRPRQLSAPHNGRSRSPHSTNDVSTLDMEIQLVRKERFLIIEQRKLLLEKKRLELLKEFEPSSINDLEVYAAAIAKHTLDNDQPPIPKKDVPKNVKGAPPIRILASRAIVKQMTDAISKRQKIRRFLVKHLFMALKNRIADLVEGKGQLQPDDVIRLYREAYPVETDEALLDRIEAQIEKNAYINVKESGVKGNFSEVEAKASISGQSISDKSEVKNESQDEKSKNKPVNVEVTDSAALLDAELDDWLEDDVGNVDTTDIQQTGKEVKEKEDTDILELDDDEAEKKEDITDILQQDIDELEEKGDI